MTRRTNEYDGIFNWSCGSNEIDENRPDNNKIKQLEKFWRLVTMGRNSKMKLECRENDMDSSTSIKYIQFKNIA